MTIYQRISLKDLEVNPANDRHGDLGSEEEAMEWLLVNKTEKMRELLQDIANRNGILEEPLVFDTKKSGKYRVYDGNRRVTCLKLLKGMVTENIENPLAEKVKTIRSNHDLQLDDHIECRVEDHFDDVNNLLELRHIPGNSGAGQLKWDGHEKENFLERTGKSKSINFAREINQRLIDEGYLDKDERIPLSTFNRLFSSNNMKQRVGIEKKDNQIHFLNDPESVYPAITRIAKDMIARKKTLNDVWNNQGKIAYLDELENEGILPKPDSRLDKPHSASDNDNINAKTSPEKPKQGLRQRDYLIPTDIPMPEKNEYFSDKFCLLFYELQNTLRFRNHLISIAIAFRAFLDILTASYIERHDLDVHKKAGLASKIQAAFEHMNKTEKMPETARSFITKLSDENEYYSINMLHKAAHNHARISDEDLRTYANNLDAYIRRAIEDINHLEVRKGA